MSKTNRRTSRHHHTITDQHRLNVAAATLRAAGFDVQVSRRNSITVVTVDGVFGFLGRKSIAKTLGTAGVSGLSINKDGGAFSAIITA